ncbi:MAG: sensor domain-containing diguanylate cyclase [Nocardioides sp.]|uniref:sensor domain-containing diguanylate cyclase n=1 Tax=Nocardioides sp. TaxID=35761 RepID=UPI0039E3588D
MTVLGEAAATTAADMFELAPVALWLEDFSGLVDLLTEWRADGVTDLRAHLDGRIDLLAESTRRLRVLAVNRCTLEMLGARDLDDLVDNLDSVFRGDMFEAHLDEVVACWEGRREFTTRSVNYTLGGKRLDVEVKVTVLPGHEETWSRVMVAVEDITDRVKAQQALEESEQYARGLFDHSPVSLLVQDFSGVKQIFDRLRAEGVDDFVTLARTRPELAAECMAGVRITEANQQTLALFGARDRDHLRANVATVLREESRRSFVEMIGEMWHGRLHLQRELVVYSIPGERIDVHYQLSVFPGHEDDWSMTLCSMIDISARKRAETYLEYLGTHDTLTALSNRAFFNDEIVRLAGRGPWPVSVAALDLNGLKAVNDEAGHAAGDGLLRRAGEVLAKAVDTEAGQCAARIGGDEFALLLPATDEAGAQRVVGRVRELIELNNLHYGEPALDFAIGTSTASNRAELRKTLHAADEAMYVDKRGSRRSLG